MLKTGYYKCIKSRSFTNLTKNAIYRLSFGKSSAHEFADIHLVNIEQKKLELIDRINAPSHMLQAFESDTVFIKERIEVPVDENHVYIWNETNVVHNLGFFSRYGKGIKTLQIKKGSTIHAIKIDLGGEAIQISINNEIMIWINYLIFQMHAKKFA